MTIKFEASNTVQGNLFSRRLKKLLLEKENFEILSQNESVQQNNICMYNVQDNKYNDNKKSLKYVTISYFYAFKNNFFKQKMPDFNNFNLDNCEEDELKIKQIWMQFYYSGKFSLSGDKKID